MRHVSSSRTVAIHGLDQSTLIGCEVGSTQFILAAHRQDRGSGPIERYGSEPEVWDACLASLLRLNGVHANQSRQQGRYSMKWADFQQGLLLRSLSCHYQEMAEIS
jgi:hypothetical protein